MNVSLPRLPRGLHGQAVAQHGTFARTTESRGSLCLCALTAGRHSKAEAKLPLEAEGWGWGLAERQSCRHKTRVK
ncbi:hypothetical protein PoB_005427400 [Plakobranchus ocellatus]|uniref:Uncharacterized protein n=1 Tax=Plakobranchus ocellatus TaxID=259542 RepID=A0AAV4C5D3_9GAST|nr:hypothetical protein PoB_005427400 [Plakobranchus ocellatus]